MLVHLFLYVSGAFEGIRLRQSFQYPPDCPEGFLRAFSHVGAEIFPVSVKRVADALDRQASHAAALTDPRDRGNLHVADTAAHFPQAQFFCPVLNKLVGAGRCDLPDPRDLFRHHLNQIPVQRNKLIRIFQILSLLQRYEGRDVKIIVADLFHNKQVLHLQVLLQCAGAYEAYCTPGI